QVCPPRTVQAGHSLGRPVTQTRPVPVDARRPGLTTRHWLCRPGSRPVLDQPAHSQNTAAIRDREQTRARPKPGQPAPNKPRMSHLHRRPIQLGRLGESSFSRVRCGQAPLSYWKIIDVVASTPVNARSLTAVIRAGAPSTRLANETG